VNAEVGKALSEEWVNGEFIRKPTLTVYLSPNAFHEYWLDWHRGVGVPLPDWEGTGQLQVYYDDLLVQNVNVIFSSDGAEYPSPMQIEVHEAGYYIIKIDITKAIFPESYISVREPSYTLKLLTYLRLSLIFGPIIAIVGVLIMVVDFAVKSRRKSK
jgi:hypothetical protein